MRNSAAAFWCSPQWLSPSPKGDLLRLGPSPLQLKLSKRLSSQTNPVSRIAVALKTSRSDVIGKPREARTSPMGVLRSKRSTRP